MCENNLYIIPHTCGNFELIILLLNVYQRRKNVCLPGYHRNFAIGCSVVQFSCSLARDEEDGD